MSTASNEIYPKLKVRNKIIIQHIYKDDGSFYLSGIHSVLVALLAQRAEVKYDPEHLLPSQIAGLIKDLGFRAQVLETSTRGNDILDLNVSLKLLFFFDFLSL